MDKTLLIMAAGMGSRFGGLKQIEPMGPNGEFLIDYSIYDALQCGFTKVVFVIKRENEQIFKETVGQRIEKKIKVEYAYQDLDDLPEGYTCPSDRVKPWGTSQAVLAARNLIHEPFIIINSDDFYGRDAYRVASQYLDGKKDYDYFVVGYKTGHTLSQNGSVKRGVCFASNNQLEKLIESKIEAVEGRILASPLDGSEPFTISEDTLVSMNMLGFDPTVFVYLEEHFKEFLETNKENIMTCEYLIPESMKNMIKDGYAKVELLKTDAKWLGVTYMKDKEEVVRAIRKLIDDKVYPENLWVKSPDLPVSEEPEQNHVKKM